MISNENTLQQMIRLSQALMAGVFIFMPFSEYRVIESIWASTPHQVSITIPYLAIAVAISVCVQLICIRKSEVSYFLNSRIFYFSIFLLGLAFVTMIVMNKQISDISIIDSYRLLGIFLVFLFSYVGLCVFHPLKLVSFIFLFCISLLILESIGLILIWFNYDLLIRNQLDVLNPSFVTMVRPHQAALFFSCIFFLGAGAALFRRNARWLYFFVPVTWLAILETGSRATTFMMAYLWVLLVVVFLVHSICRCRWHGIRDCIHICIVTVAMLPVSLYMDMTANAERSLSVFQFSILDILTGKADFSRHEMWYGEAGAIGGSLHNSFLDIYYSSGLIALLLFLLFLLFLLGNIMFYFYFYFQEKHSIILASLFAGMILIIGQLYANPSMTMPFIWFFMGLTIYMLSYLDICNERERESIMRGAIG